MHAPVDLVKQFRPKNTIASGQGQRNFMTRIILSLFFTVFLGLAPAAAQQNVWVQIEAQPSLNQAQSSIRSYAAQIQDVNGFSLGSGWYAIALGPYEEGEANAILRNLRGAGLIPRDSYIAQSADYRQQFWPVGANLLNTPALEVPDTETEQASTDPAQSTEPEPVE